MLTFCLKCSASHSNVDVQDSEMNFILHLSESASVFVNKPTRRDAERRRICKQGEHVRRSNAKPSALESPTRRFHPQKFGRKNYPEDDGGHVKNRSCVAEIFSWQTNEGNFEAGAVVSTGN